MTSLTTIIVNSAQDLRLQDYVKLKDVNLRKKLETENGLYLAESEKVILRSLEAGHKPRSFLMNMHWYEKLKSIFTNFQNVPVFVLPDEEIMTLTGFNVHRGALASFERPQLTPIETVLEDARILVILDGLADHTNVGAIFRSVAGLGAHAVAISPTTADPLYRRSVRVSMGAVFDVPWAKFDSWRGLGKKLKLNQYLTVGMDLSDNSIDLNDFDIGNDSKVAIVLGTEGHGLTPEAKKICDTFVKIGMFNGVDSLNVATSAAVMMWAIQNAQIRKDRKNL